MLEIKHFMGDLKKKKKLKSIFFTAGANDIFILDLEVFFHENREVFANSIRQNPLVLILFLRPAKATPAGLCRNFQVCSTSHLPPCSQEKNSCIAAPFSLNPFLAVRSSHQISSQKRTGKESQDQALTLPVIPKSPRGSSTEAKRWGVQLKLCCVPFPGTTSWLRAENKPRQKLCSQDGKC